MKFRTVDRYLKNVPKDISKIIYSYTTKKCDECNRRQHYCSLCEIYMCICDGNKKCHVCKRIICKCENYAKCQQCKKIICSCSARNLYRICSCHRNFLCIGCEVIENN